MIETVRMLFRLRRMPGLPSSLEPAAEHAQHLSCILSAQEAALQHGSVPSEPHKSWVPCAFPFRQQVINYAK